ncbi:hypothetical protein ACOBQX_04855 [Actinokineospora sp. G85]|uniref:hypothetical protein n=1 Tax=Actinokineospora sp. G85 TaxID=3406626 RepID=UPI003C726182
MTVLHDASVPGLRLAARAKATLGSRALVVGLSPAQARGMTSIPALRGRRHDPADLADLRLPHADTQWLAEGWWRPVGALAPRKLLAAVDRADPAHRQAAALGFLTWPGWSR